MSVKTKLARKAVKSTAKHTARGTASKFAHKPFRSITLLTAGALIGLVVGWLIANHNSTEGPSGTGAV
jgi:F0F1-type ATP synthase assembly protein I